MKKLVSTVGLALCLLANLSEAQDLAACVIAQKVKDSGDLNRALSLYTTCIEKGNLFDSSKSVALNNRGNVHLYEGRYNYAIADFNESIRLNPKYSKAYNNRGMANQYKGLYIAAADDYSLALEIDADHLNAANNLAWIKATCPVRSVRNGEQAIELATRVSDTTSYQNSIYLDTLAAAYAETGKFKLAVAYQRKAIQLATATQQKQQKDRLLYYQQDRPYRDLSSL